MSLHMKGVKGHIKNRSTGLVMGIAGNDENKGAQIVTWDLNSADGDWDKVWEFQVFVAGGEGGEDFVKYQRVHQSDQYC